jgi:hypothetical protein
MTDVSDPMKASLLVSGPAVPHGGMAEPQSRGSRSDPRIVDLIAGTARAGVNASAVVAGAITSRSVKIARDILPAGIADGPLEALERQVGRRQDEARRSEQLGLDDVTKAAESVLNRLVVEIVDMLDMEQLIDHVPINRVVAKIDLPGVINEIDLAGIVREGTKGLGGETLDSARTGVMAMDQWSARLVDKILRRKGPRDLAPAWSTSDHSESVTSEVQA